MFRTKKNQRAAAKSEFSAADRLAAIRVKVSPTAQKGAVAARAYGPLAREKAALAAALATEAAKTYGPMARGRAQAAADWSRPRVELVVERAQPQLAAARGKARPQIERVVEVVGPHVQDVRENFAPRLDASRDQIVDEWLPRVSAAMAAMVAASNAAREQAAGVSDRAPMALSVLKGESVVAPPTSGRSRGGRSRGKVFLALGVLTAIGAAVAALMNRKPKDDPWAAPLSDPTTGVNAGSASGGTMGELKGRAAETAGVAKERAAAVAAAAKERASSVAGSAKQKAASARGRASSAPADAQEPGSYGASNGVQSTTGMVDAGQMGAGQVPETPSATPAGNPSERGQVGTDANVDPAEDLDSRSNEKL